MVLELRWYNSDVCSEGVPDRVPLVYSVKNNLCIQHFFLVVLPLLFHYIYVKAIPPVVGNKT